MIEPRTISTLPGRTVLDSQGTAVGTLITAYSDHRTHEPMWATVRRAGTSTPDLIVPLHGATATSQEGGDVQLSVTTPILDGSPFIDPNEPFTATHADTLTAYYDTANRLTHSSPPLTDSARASASAHSSAASAGVVRSEEQLRVGVEAVPVERVRLQKVIVEEQKTITVTLRREEFRLTRAPLTAGDAPFPGASRLGNGAIEMTLHEERLLVTKEVVPVERVHVDVIQMTTNLDVTDSVRSERVDVTTTPTSGNGFIEREQ